MIRELTRQDEQDFCKMADAFYHSTGVLHPIPVEHHARTFEELMSNSPYIRAYIIEEDGKPAGYGLLALSYSNEAGGLVVWVDELYIMPAFQGKGLGQAFLQFIKREYGGKAARLRLEIEPENEGARRLYAREGFSALAYQQMVLEEPQAPLE